MGANRPPQWSEPGAPVPCLCDRYGLPAMSAWWLLVFVALLFTNGVVAWCVAQSRVTSQQREWRVRSGVLSIVDEAAAPVIGQRLNRVEITSPPYEAPS